MIKKAQRGILLHLGCFGGKQPGFVGIGAQSDLDVVHELEKFPYPIKDEECLTILAPNVLQRIKPWNVITLMNEIWRIAKPKAQLAITVPYAGAYTTMSDPTSCSSWTEASFSLFDPRFPQYQIHKPRPWTIENNFPIWNSNGVVEVIMRKIHEA